MLVRTTLLCGFLVMATTATAQQPTTVTGERRDVTPPKTPVQSIPHLYEFDLSFGGSYFRGIDDPLKSKLEKGGILGASFTANAWTHVGIETRYIYYGTNNLKVQTANGGFHGFGSRDFSVSINPVFHFTDRLARVRPYASVGWGVNTYAPTRDAKAEVSTMAPLDAVTFTGLDTSAKSTFNAALGIKWRMNKSGSFGMRFDVRGQVSGNPKFNIISEDHTLWGWQPTIGLNWWFGVQPQAKEFERTITITNPAPPPLTRNSISGSGIQGAVEVCGGNPVNLSIASTATPGVTLRYQWALNGTNVGTNQNTYSFTAPEAGGNQTVTVTMTDTATGNLVAPPLNATQSFNVRPYVRPTVRVTASAAEVNVGGSVPVAAAVTGDCGGALTTTWTASEGTITPNAQNATLATFNSTSVNFPGTGDQVKQITLTANVRDTRNGAASATAQIGVRRNAVATQLFDILFTAAGAVVNNCGQRILTDDVYPQFRSGYSVVLVGHTDATDKNAANLDRNRTYNVGRLLATGGRSPNNKIAPQNIKVDWVGTDQTAAKRSKQCEASVREAAGRTIAANDAAAANRRVEVWLVPNGAPMPASVRQAKDLPAEYQK